MVVLNGVLRGNGSVGVVVKVCCKVLHEERRESGVGRAHGLRGDGGEEVVVVADGNSGWRTRQGKARGSKARQGKGKQDKARQGKARFWERKGM